LAKVFFVAPASANVGLTSICLGLLRALDNVGMRVAFFKPFAQSADTHNEDETPSDRSVVFARSLMGLQVPNPLSVRLGQDLTSRDQSSLLMEHVIGLFETIEEDAEVVIVEGLVPHLGDDYGASINVAVARTLNAEVILVASPAGLIQRELEEKLALSERFFEDPSDPNIVGYILNKIRQKGLAGYFPYETEPAVNGKQQEADDSQALSMMQQRQTRLLATIPWEPLLMAQRMSDIAEALGTRAINMGDAGFRRVTKVTVCARTLPNMVDTLKPGTLVITPGDREDIVVACCMAAITGVPLAGMILTGNLEPDPRTLKLCMRALDTGLTLLSTAEDTYVTANKLSRIGLEVPVDDFDRIESVMSTVAEAIDVEWLSARIKTERRPRLSPAAFRYQLTKRARTAGKTIILPEGNEPRTIQAATICSERGIAKCILIGKEREIRAVAAAKGFELHSTIKIVDPANVIYKYIQPMVELRKHKGLTRQMAEAQLEDRVVLGTMMLAMGEVDGLVSGAVHTTANTVRPALQLIKARPGCRIVSSVFFMCLPKQVVVYGDCAINPDPTAEELADIALQCADSAQLFGIDPKVAMISYSTGTSGGGSEVEKVRKATELARAQRPELLLDGPLQYDAAAIKDVAVKKAPDSKVAGNTTVFVFPDLNTGNTTYKAVQRSANVVSMGPMLQGLKKPVNDLSRGALVEDIVFTIALTAVQATQNTTVLPAESYQPDQMEQWLNQNG